MDRGGNCIAGPELVLTLQERWRNPLQSILYGKGNKKAIHLIMKAEDEEDRGLAASRPEESEPASCSDMLACSYTFLLCIVTHLGTREYLAGGRGDMRQAEQILPAGNEFRFSPAVATETEEILAINFRLNWLARVM